ncbi:MAG TPA: hypothetical protein VGD81_13890 [Opitutaceae bacterium]
MKNLTLLGFVLAGLALVAAGCSTFESRSKEKSYVFNTLDPATRARLKERNIVVGDTMDMVYIALGAPDEKREKVERAGTETVWIYNAYWQEYQGEALLGYRRVVFFDRRSKTYRVYYEPVRESVYSQHEEERIRVNFKDGKVTVVEQAKGGRGY